MSEDQIAAFLSRLNDDALLREKFQNAPDLDAAVALAEEAGFKVSKADWHKFLASDNLELSDEDLEGVAGGGWALGGRRLSRNCATGDRSQAVCRGGAIAK